ncbi:polynucleotide 5'-hydroxyl-kinase NOL9 [Anolis carolinensis]|uniref:polynucleotide 5'-hydroxyl-kinase NOL9 n=1 Tax=Anolis carolinensis TaxID=28377 RepID=UPI002F2B37DA
MAAKGVSVLLRRQQQHKRRRKLLRKAAQRRQGRARAKAVPEPETEAWREFAASFVAAGLVPPPEKEAWTVGKAYEGSVVVLLPQGRVLTFTGKCCLTCLYGSVRVFGFTINPDQPPCHLFSPDSHCPLSIQALEPKGIEASEKEGRTEARSILRAHQVPQESRCKLMKTFSPQCAIVLLEHLDTPVTRFILSHPSFAHIFRAKRQKVPSFAPEDAILASAGIGKVDPESGLMMSESTISAIEELTQACQEEVDCCPVILVCGPKSVGKSTFNRYLINLLLNRLPCVAFLECDLGQPEFTPPGCISLLNVTEPLLGPPFTHQRSPRRMVYFGETSCEQDTERYLDTLKYVFRAYERDAPLVINTMGWVKGSGLLLLLDLIRLLAPSHLVQISAQGFQDMPRLSPEYMHHTPGLHTRGPGALKGKGLRGRTEAVEEQPRSHGAGHKLLCVQPQFLGAGAAGHARTHSSTLRDLALLGYLGQLQPPEQEPVLPLHSLVPYQVPFAAVALRVIHAEVAPSHVLCALNASWVGLCQMPEGVPSQVDGPVLLTQTPICDCLGFGIIRGVDVEKQLYQLLTPVLPEKLRLVNCLLVGNISIPHCIFLNQVGIEGEAPYVTSGYNFDISGAGKLKVKRHLKRRGLTQLPT